MKLTNAERAEHRTFVMRGGPADGNLLRLYRGNPAGQEESGWERLAWDDTGHYELGDCDPYTMDRKRPNKARTNVPHMVWVTA